MNKKLLGMSELLSKAFPGEGSWPVADWATDRPRPGQQEALTSTVASLTVRPSLLALELPRSGLVALQLARVHIAIAKCVPTLGAGKISNFTADATVAFRDLHQSLRGLQDAQSDIAEADKGSSNGNFFSKAGGCAFEEMSSAAASCRPQCFC